jgi:beta-galactosidase
VSPRHPLTAGLSTGDVVFRSGERIFGWTSDEFVADDVFSYIVDYRDVAPFARFENDFKKLMVNGMVNADAWKYIVNLPVEQCVFKLVWPKPQTFESLTWIGNKNYLLARQAEFQFDGGPKVTFDFAPNDEPQDFDLKPPRPAKEIMFKITKWDEKPDTHALSGLDNLSLYAQRPPEFLATVKPLLNIGGLMFYQRGAGGILLANLRFKATEAVPENAVKKRAIFATLLRNLKAPFSGGRTVIAGANLRYEPVDISKQCTQFRNEKGWFGDPKFTFAGMPSGRQTFAGVPFDLFEFETSPVPNAIMLGGEGVPNHPPREVKGIPVGRKADALFFLLAARLDQRMNDDDRRNNRQFETARFVVTYADGQTAEIPIQAEVDVDHYRQKEPRSLPGAQIAWTRPYAGTDETAVAYLKQWTNPRPGVEIKSLDFVYGKEPRGVPALLALTAALPE